MADLEEQLAALAGSIEWPPTPRLSLAIASKTRPVRRVWTPPRWARKDPGREQESRHWKTAFWQL